VLGPNWKGRQATKDLAKDIDDVLIYALYPVTGLKFLKWKYGKEAPPADTRPVTLEQVRKQDELVQKAKAGLLVEKPQKKAPAPSENLRKFNVFVDGDYFEVGSNPGGAPVVNTSAHGARCPPTRGPPLSCAGACRGTAPESPRQQPPKAARRHQGRPARGPHAGHDREVPQECRRQGEGGRDAVGARSHEDGKRPAVTRERDRESRQLRSGDW
jgi:hypothetical protein